MAVTPWLWVSLCQAHSMSFHPTSFITLLDPSRSLFLLFFFFLNLWVCVWYVCAQVSCVCKYVSWCTWVWVCALWVCMWWGAEVGIRYFNCFYTLFLEIGSTIEPWVHHLAILAWLSCKSQRSSCLCLPSADYTHIPSCPPFYTSAGNQTQATSKHIMDLPFPTPPLPLLI